MLHLCDLCQTYEYLLEEFSKFNMSQHHTNDMELSNLINYGLNPIVPIIYENLSAKIIKTEVEQNLYTILGQICQFQRDFQLIQFFKYDLLYGWDFLIKFFLLNNQHQQTHFSIFKLIIQKTTKEHIPENWNLDHYLNHIYQKCQQLLKDIQEQDEIKQLEQLKKQKQITDLILIFRIRNINCLFNDIEKVFFNNYTLKTNLNIFYDYFKYKILFSALVQQDNINIQTTSIYIKFGNYISIESIFIILIPYLNICHKFWEFNFKSLQQPQKISLINNIIDRFKTNQLSQFTLLLLSKKMKIMKEYYLSLILYSLFRSLQKGKSQYFSYVYYQMGKLCLYLKQYENSFNFYKYSLENSDQQKSKNISYLKFREKILMKIIIVSIFTNHRGTRKQAIEIFTQEYLKFGNKKNEILTTSSQAIFVIYIQDLLYENKKLQEALASLPFMEKYCSLILSTTNQTLPTKTLQTITDCKELKNSQIFSTSNELLQSVVGIVQKSKSFIIDRQDSQSLFKKSEIKIDMPEFPQKSNLFNSYIQLLLMIYTNFQTADNSLEYNLYISNKEKITILLQSMNQQTLSFLPIVLNECSLTRQEQNTQKYQIYYDKFYKAHIYMYIRNYSDAEIQINSIQIEDLFKKFNNTKTYDKKQFQNEFLRLQTRCMIKLSQLKSLQSKDPQILYEIGCYYHKLFLNNINQQNYSEISINCFNEAINQSQFTNNYRNFYYLMSLNHVKQIHQIITGSICDIKYQNNNLFKIPVIIFQDVGYLQDLKLIKKFKDNLLYNQIDAIIAKILIYQNYVIEMKNDFKFKRNLNDQIQIIEYNGQLFTLKRININCLEEQLFFEQYIKAFIEILCLLRIRELDKVEYCQLIQFKYEYIDHGKNIQMFLLMKYFDRNTNIKNQIIQIMDAVRILNENNIFINNLNVCSIFQQNDHPMISDFSNATIVIDSVIYKLQSQKNQISFINNDVYYFGHLIYEIITGQVLNEQDVKNSQNFKQCLDLIQDLRMKRIIELATLPYMQRPKLIELRYFM